MADTTHWTLGLALSLALHAAALFAWPPDFLPLERTHVAGDIAFLSMAVEEAPPPSPPMQKKAATKTRPHKRTRMVKRQTETPVKPVALREPQVVKSAPPCPAPLPHPAAPVAGPGPAPSETEAVGGLPREELMSLYASRVRQRIETRKAYPRRAQRQNMEGAVRIRFVLSPEGDVKEVTIIRASRFSMLNNAAKNAVFSAAPFPSLPDGMGKEPISLEVTLCFELT